MKHVKRILCLVSAMVMIFSAASAVSAASYQRGDANGDGVVNILDATTIQMVLARLLTDNDGMIEKRGAVTGEKLGIMDATVIQRYLAQIENPLGIGETVTDETQAPTKPGDEYELPIIFN